MDSLINLIKVLNFHLMTGKKKNYLNRVKPAGLAPQILDLLSKDYQGNSHPGQSTQPDASCNGQRPGQLSLPCSI